MLWVYELWHLSFFCLFPSIFLCLTVNPTFHFLILQPSYCSFVIFALFFFYHTYLVLFQLRMYSTAHHILIFFLLKWLLYLHCRLFFSIYTYSIVIPLEKEMTTHPSTLAWKIPWTVEPGGLQSMGSRRVGHDWATSLSLFTFTHWRRKWQPTPVFLPRESQGQRSLVGCRLWGSKRVRHDWSDLAAAALSFLRVFPENLFFPHVAGSL